MAYAGFWLRVVAVLIDGFIVYIAQMVIVLAAGAMAPAVGSVTSSSGAITGFVTIVAFLMVLLLEILYWPILESSKTQATLGKMAVGIKVTDHAGNRVSFLRALGRNLAKIVSGLLLFTGFLLVAFTERKQGLHDIWAGTLVVKKAAAA
jgi:uncharacterized RDD family membrane protein YckC